MEVFWSRSFSSFKIPKVGPKILEYFEKARLHTVLEVLTSFPLRFKKKLECGCVYEDLNGQESYIEGVVIHSPSYPPKNTKIFKALIWDALKTPVEVVFFQHHQWLAHQLQIGRRVRLYGKLIKTGYGWQMAHPEIEAAVRDQRIIPMIEPVYSQHQGISQKILSESIRFLMAHYADRLQKEPCRFYELFKILHALDLNEEQMKHFDDLYQRAHTEMAYWEALAYFRQPRAREEHVQKTLAQPLKVGKYTQKLLNEFPYRLTQGQEAIWEGLSRDLQRTVPLHRLIQGDVGSGKTILGFLALMMALDAGAQGVFMAPTELLAHQHYEKLTALMGDCISCVLLTGSVSMSLKKSHYEAIRSGLVQIVIGTQAVFQDQVVFSNLALVVIDEQQRFGVAQRTRLLHKAQEASHHLTLTATPIPRTLSQALFGLIDYCVLKEKPQGRLAIKTYTVPGSKREMVLRSIKNALAKKHSVYWVCPLIEESETLEVKAAVHSFEQLSQEPILRDYKIGLLHGKMSGPDRQKALKSFYEQEYHILVSTLVIEVGIDDPKANLIVIESPERLGLAQLHQLRGRVGRGGIQSYCLLIYDPSLSEKGIERLQALCEHDDGFALAEIDLKMRGPGEFLGSKQSGFQNMKFFNFENHKHLIDNVPSGLEKLSLNDHSKLDDLFGFNVQKEYWEC